MEGEATRSLQTLPTEVASDCGHKFHYPGTVCPKIAKNIKPKTEEELKKIKE